MTTTNNFATKDQLLAAANGRRRFREVALPVSGLTLRVRSLTEGEVSAYFAHVATAKSDAGRGKRIENATRRLFALCLVDGDGNRLLSDADSESMAGLDAADSQVLYDACATHAGISQRDIEDLVKNSVATGDGEPPAESHDAPVA